MALFLKHLKLVLDDSLILWLPLIDFYQDSVTCIVSITYEVSINLEKKRII